VSACTRPAGFPLAKSANFPPSLAGSRDEVFDTSHEVSSRQLKYFGKLKDGGKRGTVFTAFQEAYVLGMVPALEGKCLLSEMSLLPELNKHPRKCSLLWRALFLRSWHPQIGVCGLSINTSTKYSIPLGGGYLLGNPLKSSGLEAA
jgi:hypothetical protein